MRTFGGLIADLQREREWSYAQLSRASRVSVTRLQAILKMDTPDINGETWEKLATAFDMTVPRLRDAYEDWRERGWRRSAETAGLLDRLQAVAESRGEAPLSLLGRLVAQAERPLPSHLAAGTGQGVRQQKARAKRPAESERPPEGGGAPAENHRQAGRA